MEETKKNIADIVEVKAKIERIEQHLKLFKEGQLQSAEMHDQNSKKLDLIINTFTDSPYNAENGFVKRLNKTEKTVDNHVLYWQVAVGTIGSGSALILIVKFIMTL